MHLMRSVLSDQSSSTPLTACRNSCLNAPYGARCFLTWEHALWPAACWRLNAPYGARCFLTTRQRTHSLSPLQCLNAPYGARCFLTWEHALWPAACWRLNAPYGARCFLTGEDWTLTPPPDARLNAPYGARCFLTRRYRYVDLREQPQVLMHLMALGAF